MDSYRTSNGRVRVALWKALHVQDVQSAKKHKKLSTLFTESHSFFSIKSAEVYDPSTNSWTLVAPLCHPRSGVGAATIGNHIYALGGYDGQDHLSSVEKYDTESDEWEVVGQMVHKRWRFGCCC
jgi:N-acetylneuraminic acid mutarotase